MFRATGDQKRPLRQVAKGAGAKTGAARSESHRESPPQEALIQKGVSKVFWMDTETTGLDPCSHAMIQLGFIVEINGEEVQSGQLLARPHEGDKISREALEVHGRSLEEIGTYPFPSELRQSICKIMGSYVDKYDPRDKFLPAGWFVHFDIDFLRQFFYRLGDKYYGSWFYNISLDVKTSVAERVASGLWLPNYKLGTVCEHFEIELDEAHDALADIRATRELYRKLKEENYGITAQSAGSESD